MPKRSFDFDEDNLNLTMPEKVQRKTERSHEENQERAYVAASRRADRSIEARLQSARMASEIHKKRTGKGFRITEEIVAKEEMYEEEDDDLPRSFRLLGSNMQSTSQDANMRFDGYPNNRLAMSTLIDSTHEEWRENAINKLFDQSFPLANYQAQQFSHHMPQHSLYFGTEGMPQGGLPPQGFRGFQNMPQGSHQGMSQDSHQGMYQGLHQGMSQGMSQSSHQGMSQGMPQNMPQNMSQNMSQSSHQGMSQGMSRNMSQGSHEGMSQSSHEGMSQNMSQGVMASPGFQHQALGYPSASPLPLSHYYEYSMPAVPATDFVARDPTLSPLANTSSASGSERRLQTSPSSGVDSLSPVTPVDSDTSPPTFTSEIPDGAKHIVGETRGAGPYHLFDVQRYGQHSTNTNATFYPLPEMPWPPKTEASQNLFPLGYSSEAMAPNMCLETLPQNTDTHTNTNAEEEPWDTFLDEAAWTQTHE